VYELADLLKQYPQAEFNIEGNPLIEYMHFIERVKPTQCTLVPDEREAFTSNHGWQLREIGIADRLRPLINRLKELGCRVSLFMDAVTDDIELAQEIGADRIEMYTEPYAAAFASGDPRAVDAYAATAQRASELGLGVNAGHDLNLLNLPTLLRAAPRIAEVSIGHALIADALEFGLPRRCGSIFARSAPGALENCPNRSRIARHHELQRRDHRDDHPVSRRAARRDAPARADRIPNH
jgi:pyridoxine 5-phosphate synthase